jgi:hypothetical protein
MSRYLRSKARGIDAVTFFSQDEEFRRFFANCDKVRTVEDPKIHEKLTSYVKRPGGQPEAPAVGCRTIY